jgi:serine protease Do
VIGINTAIYSPSGGSVGIGFAIPSNVAKHVIDQLEQHGKVSWGWIGVEIQSITPAIARSLGLDPSHPEGALVASVALGGPAAKAGLESGDVITAAGDHPIKDVHDLPRLVAETPIGSTLDLAVHRGGKTQTIAVAVGEMPSKVAEAGGEASRASALGMELAPLTPQLRRQLRIGKEVRGVVVMRMAAGSPAAALGIEPGDVIESIDRKPTTSPQEAAAQLKEAAQHDNILLLLDRHGVTQFVALSVGNGAPGG